MAETPEGRKTFKLERQSRLFGKRKVGLDSNIIIDLLECPNFFIEKNAEIFGDNEVYVHRISLEKGREVTKILIEKGHTEAEAEKLLEDFIKNNHIKIIERDRANRETVVDLYRRCKERNGEMHPPDCFIIADFKKYGVNYVYSTNRHFNQACGIMGIGVGTFPTMEKEIADIFRKMYGNRMSKRRRR